MESSEKLRCSPTAKSHCLPTGGPTVLGAWSVGALERREKLASSATTARSSRCQANSARACAKARELGLSPRGAGGGARDFASLVPGISSLNQAGLLIYGHCSTLFG